MSTQYVGEIRMFAGNFAPDGWSFCDGSLLSISEDEVLFTLLGTAYGGDGVETFGLPDLRGRLPVHQGAGPGGSYVPGETGGSEAVTLTQAHLPGHRHALTASSELGNQAAPDGHVPARSNVVDAYTDRPPDTEMAPGIVSSAGGGVPHDNVQPYLCISFIIARFGIFPSQS